MDPGQLRLMDAEEKQGTEEGAKVLKQIEMSRTLFNKSSVSHNIITNNGRFKNHAEMLENGGGQEFQGSSTTLNRNIHHHKKSISEYN